MNDHAASPPNPTPLRVAVPQWRGRISPVFDVAEQLLVVDLDRNGGGRQQSWTLADSTFHQRARQLTDLRVDVLICGAISWPLEALLTAQAIQVIPFVCGDVDEVLRAFREGTLLSERFAMPGCCRRRQQIRGRCHSEESINTYKEKS